ncbi:MAG: 50S ribosomal protein L22 [Deltaproteobacteria bacterium]|nr:50S ribosomal protein L22 [Deltaproteobacteria bacterium]RLA91475.1 MAG: 50S ribosomal protein L22 [Deltaproteobacteria bacterium]
MESQAKVKYVRIAPRKARLVADLIRGQTVNSALGTLIYTKKAAAKVIIKLLKSAVANASSQSNVDVDKLFIKKIFVDSGPTLKRFIPRAMGRATRIRKRTCHITVVLDEK